MQLLKDTMHQMHDGKIKWLHYCSAYY